MQKNEITVKNLFNFQYWKISRFPNDIFVREDKNPEVELTSVENKKIGFKSVFTGNREARRAFISKKRSK